MYCSASAVSALIKSVATTTHRDARNNALNSLSTRAFSLKGPASNRHAVRAALPHGPAVTALASSSHAARVAAPDGPTAKASAAGIRSPAVKAFSHSKPTARVTVPRAPLQMAVSSANSTCVNEPAGNRSVVPVPSGRAINGMGGATRPAATSPDASGPISFPVAKQGSSKAEEDQAKDEDGEEEEQDSDDELCSDEDLSSWGSDEEIWGSDSNFYDSDDEGEGLLAGQYILDHLHALHGVHARCATQVSVNRAACFPVRCKRVTMLQVWPHPCLLATHR